MAKKGVESESEFIRKQVKSLILFIVTSPYHIIHSILKPATIPEKIKRIGVYLKESFEWIFQAKATTYLIIINIFLFFIIAVFYNEYISLFVAKPNDLLKFNFLTIIASWFMHADLTHLFGNMVALFVFGRIVEKYFGTAKMLLIYFGSAVISTIFSSLIYLFWIKSDIGGLGASGAIMGLIAVAILVKPFYITYLLAGIPLPVMLLGWLMIFADITGILNPLPYDNVGHFAHLGGFLAISLLTFLLTKEEKEKLKKGLIINVVCLVIVAVLFYYVKGVL